MTAPFFTATMGVNNCLVINCDIRKDASHEATTRFMKVGRRSVVKIGRGEELSSTPFAPQVRARKIFKAPLTIGDANRRPVPWPEPKPDPR